MHRIARNRRWLWPATLTCAVALLFAGCSDSTSPEDFDAAIVSEAAGDVLTSFDNNPALQAMDFLGDAFPTFGATPSAAPAARPLDEHDWPARIDKLRFLERIGPFLSPADPAAIFPIDFLGGTFIYNVDTQRYEFAPDSTGAPADGIRLILYAVDPVLHRPVTPLNDIGYLDLTDESTPSADALGVLAVVEGITYLEYTASAVQSTSSVTFTADGYLSDGETQVIFTLTHEWSETSGITISYDVTVPSQNVALGLDLNVNGQTEAITLEMSVQYGNETAVLSATITEALVDGAVTYNGDLVVDISGTPQQPVFTDAAGNELTSQDLQALATLFGSIGIILDGFDNLLVPAYLVFSVSVFAGW